MLAIQRGCRATTRRPSFVYKKAVPITTNRPSGKVKQLVLLHQLIYFLITSLATGSERTYLRLRENVSLPSQSLSFDKKICNSFGGSDYYS